VVEQKLEEKRMHCTRGLTGALLLLAVSAWCAPAAGADQAVVVGVNRYPNLEGADLRGCVNDAQEMAQYLRAKGFQVVDLHDTQASKRGILDAIARVRINPNERFVFFFAGHGTDTTEGDKAALLPNDSLSTTAANDLKAKELYDAVRAVGARSRTVILDSCYSGGMLASAKKLVGPRLRYYARDIGGGAKSLRAPTNDQNTNSLIAPRDGGDPKAVCYYTAARGNEQAGEIGFNGVQHGIFTFYLLGQLRNLQRATPWGDIQTQVGGKVAEKMDDLQHPVLSPPFVGVNAFDSGAPTPTPPTPTPTPPPPPPIPAPKPNTEFTLEQVLDADRVDPRMLSLRMNPNKTTVTIGEQFSFTISVGPFSANRNEGAYLVVVEKGTSGRLKMWLPESLNTDEARVTASTSVEIPEKDHAFQAGPPEGAERLKAFLFTSRANAEAFISKFRTAPREQGADRKQLRDLFKVSRVKVEQFYTADLTFQVMKE